MMATEGRTTPKMPRRLVILGPGFSGAYCAAALQKKLRRLNAEVLLIDRNNFFVFTPLLVEAGTGGLEPRHAVVPIRAFLKTIQFRLARFWAWWMWRTVYLLKMPGWARRVRIALDWTIDLVFSRDYVQLGIHRTTREPAEISTPRADQRK